MIKADPVRLRQILENLLHNADRFTKRGHIALGAEVLPPHLHLWVEDTGPGIPIEDQERIFEPFVTAQRTDGGREGIGLGLSIARRLVALHRGSIALESQPGRGSTFHVYLPLPNLLDERQPPIPAGESVLLLISDREETPAQIDDFCRRQGIRIRWVVATENPEELLSETTPVALAWDINEANPGQLALIERLRGYPRLRRLPFVFYGRRPGEDGETSLTNFVVKPVDSKTLLDAIEALCPFSETGPVLVVEDDPDARRFLASLVQEEYPGYPVQTAADGRMAMEMMKEQAPSLVILDLMLPETDGFQVLDWMRGRRETERVPVLVLTGRPLSMEDIRRLEGHAHVTVQSKGILSGEELTAAVHRSMFGREGLPLQSSALVKRAVAFVHENYARPFSRQELAAALGVSEHHLSRIFRQELGLSPWEYLNRYRIYRAMDLLQRTNESITAIALRVGFDDSAYFSRVFRSKTGQSPSEYRASPGIRPW
jgi:AraC-like DNA-binding protein/DNA-binding response OmpR family regulator